MHRIREDDELLDIYCRRLPDKLRFDKGYRRVVEQTEEYQAWFTRERTKDIFARAEELLTY